MSTSSGSSDQESRRQPALVSGAAFLALLVVDLYAVSAAHAVDWRPRLYTLGLGFALTSALTFLILRRRPLGRVIASVVFGLAAVWAALWGGFGFVVWLRAGYWARVAGLPLLGVATGLIAGGVFGLLLVATSRKPGGIVMAALAGVAATSTAVLLVELASGGLVGGLGSVFTDLAVFSLGGVLTAILSLGIVAEPMRRLSGVSH